MSKSTTKKTAPKPPAKPKAKAKPAPKGKGAPTMQAATNYFNVSPHAIHVIDGFNPREIFDVGDLSKDIAINGVRIPLIVRKSGDKAEHGKPLELVDGQRRLTCAIASNLKNVPVNVATFDSAADGLFLALTTGAGAKPLDWIEEGTAIEALVKLGWGPRDIAEKWGRTEAFVSQRRSLLKLSGSVKKALRKGAITYTLARELAKIDVHKAQNDRMRDEIEKAKTKGKNKAGSDVDADAEQTKSTGSGPARPPKKHMRQMIEELEQLVPETRFTVDDMATVLKWGMGDPAVTEEAVQKQLGL